MGSASAIAPSPPQAFVIQLNETSSSPSGAWSVGGVLAWRASENDPNPATPTFQYTLYRNTTEPGATVCSAATGTANGCGWTRGNQTGSPITGMPGWHIVPIAISFTTGDPCNRVVSDTDTCAFNMTAWDTSTATEGPASCIVNLSLRPGAYGQCGAYWPEPPAGIAATVRTRSNTTDDGLIQAKWPISVNDTNTTIGNFTYRVRMTTTTETGSVIELLNDTDPRETTLDGSGSRIYNLTTFGTSRFYASWQAQTIDPRTFMRSNWTCVATVNADLQNDVSSCNGVASFDIAPSVYDGAIFPLVNVPNLSSKMGLDAAAGEILFGLILVGFVAGFGGVLLGLWGGIGGAAFGFAGAALFGLFPLWVVVVVFLGGVATALLLFGRGGATA